MASWIRSSIRVTLGTASSPGKLRGVRPRHRLGGRDAARTFDIGHDLRDAVVAVDPGTGDIIGVARMAPSEEGASTVEVAITVGDAFQGRGLGTRLLDELLHRAAALGATEATATTAKSNSPVHHLLRRAGFRPVRRSLGVQDWRLETLTRWPSDLGSRS